MSPKVLYLNIDPDLHIGNSVILCAHSHVIRNVFFVCDVNGKYIVVCILGTEEEQLYLDVMQPNESYTWDDIIFFLGLSAYVCGSTALEVITKYTDLTGCMQSIDEEGNTVETPIVREFPFGGI